MHKTSHVDAYIVKVITKRQRRKIFFFLVRLLGRKNTLSPKNTKKKICRYLYSIQYVYNTVCAHHISLQQKHQRF